MGKNSSTLYKWEKLKPSTSVTGCSTGVMHIPRPFGNKNVTLAVLPRTLPQVLVAGLCGARRPSDKTFEILRDT